jgi:protein TonB
VSSATVSVVVHAVVIGAWVIGTLPAANVAPDSIANRVYYIPPPDRVPTQGGSQPAVRYIELAPAGPGTGAGPRMMGDARPTPPDTSRGDQARDTLTAPPVQPTAGPDSVFSVLDVDTAVVRLASSAAPAYPIKLLDAHIMGFVQAQYVVDTTGFADTSSFKVIKATNPGFIDAVKEALPYMRFHPAKIGSAKVRQLVEQQFSFRITDSTSVASRPKKP